MPAAADHLMTGQGSVQGCRVGQKPGYGLLSRCNSSLSCAYSLITCLSCQLQLHTAGVPAGTGERVCVYFGLHAQLQVFVQAACIGTDALLSVCGTVLDTSLKGCSSGLQEQASHAPYHVHTFLTFTSGCMLHMMILCRWRSARFTRTTIF